MQFESHSESTDSASHGNLAEFKLEHFLLEKTMFESCRHNDILPYKSRNINH